jgi:hypothetical protein
MSESGFYRLRTGISKCLIKYFQVRDGERLLAPRPTPKLEDEIKSRLNSGNACYYSVQNILSSGLISKNLKIKIYKTNFASCAVWVRNLVSHFEGGIQTEGFENRVLRTFGHKR